MELGTLPKLVVIIEGARPFLVWKLSKDQVFYLSKRDSHVAPIRLDRWLGADLISLPRKSPEQFEKLYRQFTELAAKALDRDEVLLARVEYVGPADVH